MFFVWRSACDVETHNVRTHTLLPALCPVCGCWKAVLDAISEPLKERLRFMSNAAACIETGLNQTHTQTRHTLVGGTLDRLSFFRDLDTNAVLLLLAVLKPMQLQPHEVIYKIWWPGYRCVGAFAVCLHCFCVALNTQIAVPFL